MADQPSSGTIIQQYEHHSIRESIDIAYLETVNTAVELQNYLDNPHGNPELKFRPFYRAFIRLYMLTSQYKEMTIANGSREKIKKWVDPRPGLSQELLRRRAMMGLDLWDDYHQALIRAGTISRRA